MELEFDKEMNAILRKAGRQPAAAAPVSAHIDADTISAFAENALPGRARPPLIEHFAACDNCREALSQTILLNAEADATAASSAVAELPAEIVVPWYRKLFSTPGLALAMGALVLVFAGVLGFIALQNRKGGTAEVSQVKEPEQQRGGPYDNGEPSAMAANSAPDSGILNNSTTSPANSAAIAIADNPVRDRQFDGGNEAGNGRNENRQVGR